MPSPLVVPAAVLVAVLLASALAAPGHRPEALAGVARLVGGLLLGWMAYRVAATRARRQLLAQGLAVAGVLVALFGLGEFAYLAAGGAREADFAPAPLPAGDVVRAGSTLVHPNQVAILLELALPLILVGSLTAGRRALRLALTAGLLAAALALLLTFSRSGLVAVLAALTLMAGVAARHTEMRVAKRVLATMGLLVIGMGTIVIVNPDLLWRMAGETEQRWYRASYEAPEAVSARPGETLFLPIQMTNVGAWSWHHAGPYRFALGYHLLRADGTRIVYDGPSTPLASDVPPGASVQVQAGVVAPLSPGDYAIEWDGVQEAVTWFSWRGTRPALTRLQVGGEPVAPAAPLPQRFEDSVVVPAPGRLILWETGLVMAAARPLLGVGPDNFPRFYDDYAGATRWGAVHSHNLYLEWLVNAGIAGLLAFVWLSWRLVATVAASLRAGSGGDESRGGAHAWMWQLAFAGSLAAWYTHGLFDYFERFPPAFVVFWLVAGLALRGAERDGRREQT